MTCENVCDKSGGGGMWRMLLRDVGSAQGAQCMRCCTNRLEGVRVIEESDARAALARAYATGDEPKYIQPAPTGNGEVWAIGNTLVVLPLIPVDAGAQLEYALRLRRDATLSGTCDGCQAVVDVAKSPDGEVLSLHMRHKVSCPASDENAGRLLREHYKAAGEKKFQDLLQEAVVRTREDIDSEFAGVRKIEGDKTKDWLVKFLDKKLEEGSPCDHLRVQPAQTWNMSLGDPGWLCEECMLRRHQDLFAGRWRLSAIEDFTCDICRRYVRDILPLVLRVDIYVMRGGCCQRCYGKYYSESDPRVEVEG
jgi:hypothetical protein